VPNVNTVNVISVKESLRVEPWVCRSYVRSAPTGTARDAKTLSLAEVQTLLWRFIDLCGLGGLVSARQSPPPTALREIFSCRKLHRPTAASHEGRGRSCAIEWRPG
jgi:hypothetical protein